MGSEMCIRDRSGLASTRLPLEARPIGVRDVATITGSAMLTPHMY